MLKFGAVISRDVKIKDAIALMSSSEKNKYIAGIAVVVDDDSRVVGVLTDGDIRRGLSRGIGIDDTVENAANFSPVTVKRSTTKNLMLREIITQAKQRRSSYHKFDKVIVIDEAGKLDDVILLTDIIEEQIDHKVIAVYGLGYVGLTLGAVLANSGLMVFGVDTNSSIIDNLKAGRSHFFENGLESLLASLNETNPMNFTEDFSEVNADIHIVCVGTPIDEDKKPIFSHIDEVSRAIAQKLKKNDLVIFRSTLPVGTMRSCIIPILEQSGLSAGADFYVSFAPERTVEGNAIEELRTLPQVIGGFDQTSTELTAKLFAKITKTIIEVDSLEAAELVKLINNTYRDLVFSFANELAYVCDGFNINAFKLIEAANEGYPRNPIPKPSPGVGGICLSKDPYLFINPVKPIEYKPILGGSSRLINSNGHLYVYEKIERFCSIANKDLAELKIFLIGLAFKGMPETSDIRDSMALKLVEALPVKQNIYIKDFVVPREDIETTGCNFASNMIEGFEGVDVVLIMNNHYQNNRFNIAQACRLANKPALFFDGWNMLNQTEIESYENLFYATMGYMTER